VDDLVILDEIEVDLEFLLDEIEDDLVWESRFSSQLSSIGRDCGRLSYIV